MTGDCNDALRELYEFLDGELTDERRRLIHDHIERCNPCLEAFDFEVELRHVIAAKCREECPDELRSRVAAAIEAEGTQPPG